MPVEKIQKYICDLCGETKVHPNIPEGWVTFDIEDRHCERKFHCKAVCGHCLKLINAARPGMGK